MIYCQALGPIEVTIDGAPAPEDLLWRRNIGLLLYLARAPGRRCTRERAIGLFWPDKGQAAALQSLRQALTTLRHGIGATHLRTHGDQLQLTMDGFELDTERFDARVAARDWAGAAALVRGKFADGFAVPNSSAFEDWLMMEQGHWLRRSMDVLIAYAEERLDAGDLLGADEPVTRALQLDPLSQRASRTVMQRLHIAGDRAGALEVYDRLAERLGQDGGAPEPETVALAERVRVGREWRLPRIATAAKRGVDWRRAPLVARERELTAILACWRQVRTSGAALAIVEATAGAGKTRLAEEVMARVGVEGGVCVATRAVPADRDEAMAGIGALARECAERFPTARTRSPESASVSALSEVLRVASAGRPLLLVCDDTQWLDPASLTAFATLLRDLARSPILFLLAATDEPEPPALAELRARLGRDLRGVSVHLGTFDLHVTNALVRWALPSYSPENAERASRRILADSGGNPLLAVEICHAVAQGLDLRDTSGAWPRPFQTLDQTMPGDLPDTIVAAIRVGFNCLSADARAALAAAAVLGGERVTAKRLGAASRLAGDALDAALDELEWRRWLVAERRGYAFLARIVRDVVRDDMVPSGQAQRILDA